MAVVGIMSMMVVSFTIIVNSWVTLGTKRYQLVGDSELLSSVYHSFVSANDSTNYYFEIGETYNELIVKRKSDGSVKARMVFDSEEKLLTYDLNGEEAVLRLEQIDNVFFGLFGNEPIKMVYCTVDYTYVTPGKKIREQQKSYEMVVSLRSATVPTG